MARTLDNAEIAAVFSEMADMLQIQGGDRYRIRAFKNASRVLENLREPAAQMVRFGTLHKEPGIGPGTVDRVKQILRTGTCDDLQKLRAALPAGLRDILQIKGIGAKTARLLYQNLGIASVEELEHAARTGALERLPRMGESAVQKILRGIEAFKKRQGKTALSKALRIGMAIVEEMRESPAALRVELAGSVRRGKATIGDLDVLVAARDGVEVAAKFVTLPHISEVLIHGEGRCSVRLQTGQQVDMRVLPPEEFGAGLHYFTGSQLHNIAIRARGNRLGLKISDHGIFRRSDESRISPGEQEEEIFAAVGLPWIAPELRENLGEVEAAAEGRLPVLVTERDLAGDLHMHTVESDGSGTALQMIERAKELKGHSYIAITDHSKSLRVANGLDETRILAQMRQLRELEDQVGAVRVLSGVEVDILPDGDLDLDLAVLSQLDWVVGSVHAHTDMTEAEMTARVVRAIESGVVDVVGHPTGRRPGMREPYAIDVEKVLEAARRAGVAVECNGGPNRMDLSDMHCRQAREMGVPVVISTDAHSPAHLGRREYALAMARRGWLEKKDVLNTRPWQALAERRRDRMRTHAIQVPEALDALAAVAAAEPPPHESDGDGDGAHAWMDEVDPARVAAAADSVSLDLALRAPVLDAALRDRLQQYLREGVDPPLESALRTMSDNPMQKAFEILFAQPPDTDG